MPPLQSAYAQFQPAGIPGFAVDMSEWDGSTKTATATIAFGAPVQRNGDSGCTPLTSGEYIGIAAGHHVITATNADSYGQYDNVPVVNEGVWWGLSDGAITVGAAVNWNSSSGRWTTAAVAGAIYAVPGAEAESGASGAGVLLKIRLRRVPS